MNDNEKFPGWGARAELHEIEPCYDPPGLPERAERDRLRGIADSSRWTGLGWGRQLNEGGGWMLVILFVAAVGVGLFLF